MPSTLRQAETLIREAIASIEKHVLDLPGWTWPSDLATALTKLRYAQHQLASTDQAELDRWLSTECCASCDASADVVLDGAGYCARHAERIVARERELAEADAGYETRRDAASDREVRS